VGVARRRIDARFAGGIYPPPDSSPDASPLPSSLVNQPSQKPLNAFEIEKLLRASRDRQPSVRSDVVSNEPLGPGDVQYLQNTAQVEEAFEELDQEDALAGFTWPGETITADERLQRAEQQLADAIAPRNSAPTQATGHNHAAGPSSSRHQRDVRPTTSNSVASAPPGVSLEAIGEIELDVSLELGRAEVTIEELLRLREGSVVSLDKTAGEPIDILANGRLIARGEVIVVDGKFGVRVCEVIGQ
jgi:flagellar motor switch protein FliN